MTKTLNPLFFCAVIATSVSLSARASIAEHVTRAKVAGIEVLTYPMGVKDVVTLEGSLPAGDFLAIRESDNRSAATLTAMLLDKGTTTKDKFAIARQLDDVGASLSFNVGAQMLEVEGKALKKDLPRLIRTLAEELREPAFSADEFAKAKKQLAGELRRALEDTSYRAHEAFLLNVYPVGHPNRPAPISEVLAALDSVTLDEVKAFYKAHYGPEHMTLVFVGDVDASLIQSEVARDFKGWMGGAEVVRASGAGSAPVLREQRVPIADKASVSVVLGQRTGMRYQDADTVPLRVGTAILGSGFTGRLMHTVRDKEGLTYGIRASLEDDSFVDGTFAVSATFAPALLDRGVASAREVLEGWWQNGVTADELSARKSSLVGVYRVSLSNTEGMADAILRTLERGQPLTWLDDYAKAIDAVTLDQVNAVIKKRLDPTKAVLIEAGTFDAQ
jgi:zinc protease